MCDTHGELPATTPEVRRKREIRYCLNTREDMVLLVRRPRNVSLMPGMWELPESAEKNDDNETLLTLRHSITVTDYTVRVLRPDACPVGPGRWVRRAKLITLPLTGLARKILRAADVI